MHSKYEKLEQETKNKDGNIFLKLNDLKNTTNVTQKGLDKVQQLLELSNNSIPFAMEASTLEILSAKPNLNASLHDLESRLTVQINKSMSSLEKQLDSPGLQQAITNLKEEFESTAKNGSQDRDLLMTLRKQMGDITAYLAMTGGNTFCLFNCFDSFYL